MKFTFHALQLCLYYVYMIMEQLLRLLFFPSLYLPFNFQLFVRYDLLEPHCRNLRELFKIDAADYMMSICGNDALRELSSPGKSGSVFFLSQDDRFMIKTLRRSEVKVRSDMSVRLDQ